MGNPGNMKSPNYPDQYGNGEDCTWRLIAPPGRRIALSFLAFKLESHTNCGYDSLTIYDGRNTGYSQMNKLCGHLTQDDMESSGEALFLEFITDGGAVDSGFNIRYQTTGKR